MKSLESSSLKIPLLVIVTVALTSKVWQSHRGRRGRRGHREKHEPSLCIACDAEWGRPCDYRNHLEKHHPDLDPDMILGKPAGSLRRTAIIARRGPQLD